ncbi:MAG: hypothetical protein IKS17_09940 [Firmicutes bacterium]|nr:hypothetical protein [Bacillota bacterium]
MILEEPLATAERQEPGWIQVKDLKTKEGVHINTIFMYSCNSAHQNYATKNLAFEFTKYQDVDYVYGWDGSMKWSRITGKPILNSGTEYFKSWCENGNRKEYGLIRYKKESNGITIIQENSGNILNRYDYNGNPLYFEQTEVTA